MASRSRTQDLMISRLQGSTVNVTESHPSANRFFLLFFLLVQVVTY